MILRCTAKAATMLGVAAAGDVPAGDDDWYLNLVWIERRKNLLLAHARTAFPIFVADIRKADVLPLAPWLTRQIADALLDEEIAPDALGPLDPTSLVVAKTASRQVLGFMNRPPFARAGRSPNPGVCSERTSACSTAISGATCTATTAATPRHSN